jgi:hypothetical protein
MTQSRETCTTTSDVWPLCRLRHSVCKLIAIVHAAACLLLLSTECLLSILCRHSVEIPLPRLLAVCRPIHMYDSDLEYYLMAQQAQRAQQVLDTSPDSSSRPIREYYC